MNIYLQGYLIVSVMLMLIMAIRLAYEDYDMRYKNPWKRNTSKFGYHYSKKGLWWLLIGGVAPFVNLFTLGYLIIGNISHALEKR